MQALPFFIQQTNLKDGKRGGGWAKQEKRGRSFFRTEDKKRGKDNKRRKEIFGVRVVIRSRVRPQGRINPNN